VREIATQGHSRSFILQSVTGQQEVAYRHIILLALSLKFRRSSHSNRQNLPSSTTALSFEAPAKRNPASIPTYLIFSETSHRPTFSSMHVWVYRYSNLCSGLQKRIFSAPHCVLAVQGRSGSSKVDDFGTNRKRVYDFLLVGHCDYGPILHRFRDVVTYWLK